MPKRIVTGLLTIPVNCRECGGALDMHTCDQAHETAQPWDCAYCGDQNVWKVAFRIMSVTKRGQPRVI